MNVIEISERVRPLSPIVTPLPFYQRPLPVTQLAIAALAVLALIAGVLGWRSIVLSLPDVAYVQRPSAAPRAAPSRIELVVRDIDVVGADAAPTVDAGPCL
jgi:hypothetical protein